MMKLWSTEEAREWLEAYPLGNGHMGAMCYGGAGGRFDLSESCCWSGGFQDTYLRPDAGDAMERARKCLMEQDPDGAETALKRCAGLKKSFGTQLPFGRLLLAVEAGAAELRRELDLMDGVCRDTFFAGAVPVQRQSFLSNPAKVMCVRLWAEKGVLPDVCLWLEGYDQPCHTEWNGNTLTVTGRALENLHSDGLTGTTYAMELSFETDGSVAWNRRGLILEGASYCNVVLSGAASLFEKDPAALCAQRVAAAKSRTWAELLEEHREDQKSRMEACTLSLGESRDEVPTALRIAEFREDGGDLGLVALLFQYGRYLLLASSRGDSLLPAALQGVWNDNRACRMEWTDDMHLDINTQMNYHPAEVTGLGECTLPLYRWLKGTLVPNGKEIAEKLYRAPGWCAHTVSNACGWAAPGWDASWGLAVSGGAWAALHIWEHFEYTGDRAFLAAYYSVLYESARFLASLLAPDPKTGRLLVCPSYSPENAYLYHGKPHCITAGSTFDTAVAKKTFQCAIDAAEVLSRGDDFTVSLKEIIEKLPPFQVGKHGQLQEWYWDFDEAYPDHRHTSHLLAVYPFGLIDPKNEPVLASAVQQSLKRRLGKDAKDIVYANWAGALLILYHARLEDGEGAGKFVTPMISFLSRPNLMIAHQGPTSLLTGGIYELDGNTGFTAAVAEMLMQSRQGEIRLLPAVPKSWNKGKVSGLHCRGGHTVAVEWSGAKVKAVVTLGGGPVEVSCRGQSRKLEGKPGETRLVEFER